MSAQPNRDNRMHDIDRATRLPDGDFRSESEHDRDRILYSPEFRRLAGITQVITPSGSHPTHNRLTHSLEVAQIARAIAEKIHKEFKDNDDLVRKAGGLDLYVVEAAALAHDLGHPPFGHVTETALNALVEQKQKDGFEGNAQTFRILTTLSVRDESYPGLDLTRATLAATSKYPWKRHTSNKASEKWGAYESNEEELKWSRAHLSPEIRSYQNDGSQDTRTLEACIMDWADDVAYAIHDVEDFYRVGMIPLDRIKNDQSEQNRFIDYHLKRMNEKLESEQERIDAIAAQREDIEKLARTLLTDLNPFDVPYSGTRQNRAIIRRFSSGFVHRYIQDSRLEADSSEPKGWRFEPDPKHKDEVDLLKSLLWMYVIDSEALISIRFGYAQIVRKLFSDLTNAATDEHSMRLFPEFYPKKLSKNLSDAEVYRAVADFMSSLTESQLVDLHHRLTGVSIGSALNRIVT